MEKILYDAMFSKIQKEINNNKDEILNVQKIDNKYCKIKIEINKLLEIIEYYKSLNLFLCNKKDKHENLTVYCNGNPYIVLNLGMIAIINNCNIKININNKMLGVNKLILLIINNILKNNNLKIKIELFEKIENNEKIIFIDRINEFNLLKNKLENIKFIPYQSIDIFSDSENFEELYEKIYNYTVDMNIDTDIFDEEDIESLFKYGKGKIKLILTKEKDIIEKYKKENVFINENPFKDEKIIFDDEIIRKIVE